MSFFTLNGFSDYANVVAGNYISVTSNSNNVIIGNTAPGLTDATGTLPITLVLSNNNQTLTASIAVTPAHDGGAVALQIPNSPAAPNVVFAHTMQLGTAAVSNVFTNGVLGVNVTPTDLAAINRPAAMYLKPLIGTDDLFIGVNSINDVTSVLTDLGEFFAKQTVTEGDTVSTSFTLQENPWENTTFVKGHLTAVAANATDNFLNLPFSYYNTLTLRQVATDLVHPALVGTGKIVGISTLAPLVDLNIGTAPAIRLGFGTAVASASALEVYGTDQSNPSVKLSTNGEVKAVTVLAENVYVNTAYVNEPSTVPIDIVHGPQAVVADASAGQVIVQLPTIPGDFTKSILLTVKKADISTNEVSIIRGTGSLIEGDTAPINLTRSWSAVTLLSVGINWYKVSEL